MTERSKKTSVASIDLKLDCSEIEEVSKILDLVSKYADELPIEMQKELSELANNG